ncbi:hypothetical protein EIN_225130 [Entamoeba invadens IP1]|uniref:Uncharacterized protein n=1 Tax=Entamoeba invadens IP1 TaxID=370355 RepID=A0A0A1U5S7_ENTIV|nr:hypothetical protein EIN_225130 [Entamoeba invadens IP1]ELP88220.1 hypothetical protein EIN_225130 [Entamoeba invadens IP1]|eukprot:XP_004254991.1 hypothetical protein EIN_225130 [Entamoeba invadens IP1]
MGKQDFFTIRVLLYFVVAIGNSFNFWSNSKLHKNNGLRLLMNSSTTKTFSHFQTTRALLKSTTTYHLGTMMVMFPRNLCIKSCRRLGFNSKHWQIQAGLKESDMKTLRIAMVACQKALFVYTNDNSKNNVCFI